MLYHLHEFNRTMLNPLVCLVRGRRENVFRIESWMSRLPGADRVAANYELLYRLGKDYEKPDVRHWHRCRRTASTVPIVEQVALAKPFCNLRALQALQRRTRNAASKLKNDPPVLVVAPLSGHHSTLLRDTVRTLLQDHKVYITDWIDARMVPLVGRPVPSRRLRRLHPGIHPPHRRGKTACDQRLPADRAGARRRSRCWLRTGKPRRAR